MDNKNWIVDFNRSDFAEMGEDYRAKLRQRTKELAHHCVQLSAIVKGSVLGAIIGKQLMRSATSCAANYRAACLAQSIPMLRSKLSITIEELDETYFWIEFLQNENLITETQANPILQEAKELLHILSASRLTLTRLKKT